MVTMVTTKMSQSYFRSVKQFIHNISGSYWFYRRKYSRLVIVELCTYRFWCHAIYCFSVFAKLLKKQNFRFFCLFSRKMVQVSVFKVEYLENGLADFNDFGLILQDFERPFRWYQLGLALQFSLKFSKKTGIKVVHAEILPRDFLKTPRNYHWWLTIAKIKGSTLSFTEILKSSIMQVSWKQNLAPNT